VRRPPVAHGPLPLIVGVTGHRDLRTEDLPSLAASVRRLFETLRTKYPHTDLVILSPLAEGADRLAATVALDLGLRLVAALPLDRDEYEQDFSDAASVAEFNALLAKAEHSFVVPRVNDQPRKRPDCYADVGRYIARHSHVLLALWNGRASSHAGGTADIVRFRREGMATEFAPFRPLDPVDAGIVYQIVTPRRSEASTDGTAFEMRVLHQVSCRSAEEAEQLLGRVCRSTDAFNVIAANTSARLVAQRAQSARHLLPDHGSVGLPPGLEAIRALYACADQAAVHFQTRTRWTVRTLFWLAFGIIVSFELFAHGDDLIAVLPVRIKLVTYLILLAAGFCVLKWAKSREFDAKHLDYRALVEALRVQFYWRAAEVRGAAADYCVQYRLGDMEWIRMALRSCELLMPTVAWTDTPAASSAALRAVVDDWASGQHDYFRRSVRREERLLQKLERRTTFLFVLSLIGGVIVFALTFDLVPALPESLHATAVALIGLSTAAAALIHGYAEQRALSMHVKRYERMQLLFGAGLQALKGPLEAGDWQTARDLLSELGREALEENTGWVVLHRERPMELPA